MKPKVLTMAQLKVRGACFEDRELFQQIFHGDSAKITTKNVAKAIRRGASVRWLVDNYPGLFTQAALAQFRKTAEELSVRCTSGIIKHSTHRIRYNRALIELFRASGYPDA